MSMAEKVLTDSKVCVKVNSGEVAAILEGVICNQKLVPWCSLLCYEGDSVRFLNILSVAKSEVLAIMQYRRELMSERKMPITSIELVELYTDRDLGKLHKSLESLFLEVIEDEHFKFIMKRVNSESKLQNMYDRHIDNNSLRMMTIALVI